ncbi:hypothetical protein YSY22_04650 [Brevibacillus formosus]
MGTLDCKVSANGLLRDFWGSLKTFADVEEFDVLGTTPQQSSVFTVKSDVS